MSPASDNRRRGCSARGLRGRAFTLVEAATATAVMSILIVGAGAAIVASARAVDRGEDASSRALAIFDFGDQIAADLDAATSFTERSETAVAFAVPDRDGDGSPEDIRYAYDNATKTLTREVNWSEAQVVAKGIENVSLSYVLRGSGAATESAEQLIIGHTSGGSSTDFGVEGSRMCAQYAAPVFADAVVSWSITRLRIHMRPNSSSDGRIRIQVVTADGFKPSSTVLAEAVINEASLAGGGSWAPIALTKIGNLDPNQAVCIVVRDNAGSTQSCRVTYDTGSGLTFNTFFTTTSNSGSTWSGPTDSQDMRFEIYGTVTTRSN